MARISPIELQKALKGADYPADRDSLVQCAKANKAPTHLVDVLADLSRDDFDGPNEVQKAVFTES